MSRSSEATTTDILHSKQRSLFTGTYDALILDARLRQALVSLRSLGQQGLTVAALETSANVPAFFSQWCRQGYVCLQGEGTEGYLAYLKSWLQHIGARVLIPASDGTIALLQQHREELERYTSIALASNSALTIAINKERTLALARELYAYRKTLDMVDCAGHRSLWQQHICCHQIHATYIPGRNLPDTDSRNISISLR